MCGISGIVGHLVPDDAARIRSVTTMLAHRGPDDSGIWTGRSSDEFGAILGHRRLSIIDLRSIASQPMTDSASGTTLVFNGEIYNFRQLRAELGQRGHRFATDGDSEAILRGYAEWGAGVVQRLRGMFAFAIFDQKTGRVLLARDGFGIKPLYWCHVRGARPGPAIAFASEGRALVQAGFASATTDKKRVARYLWNGFVPSAGTIWSEIEELPRGCLATFEMGNDGPQISRYWAAGSSAWSTRSSRPVAEALLETARAHLTADVPKVVFLSGGVDSTALASLVAREVGKLDTLSIGFAEADADESEFASEAARAIGSNHHAVRVAASAVLEDLDAAVAALDQPSFDGTNMWFVSREAVRRGFKVALSGTGGDEMFGGYASFKRIPRLHNLLRSVPGALPSAAARLANLVAERRTEKLKLQEVAGSRGAIHALYQSQYGMFGSEVISRLVGLQPGELDPWGLPPQRLRDLAERTAGMQPLRAVSLLESELFLGDRLLRDADAVSMAHSLEVRVPFVDTSLSDELDQLPVEMRFAPVGQKAQLRAVAGVDPSFFARKKRGFEFPMDRWIRHELRDTIDAQLLDERSCRALGLEAREVARIWSLFLERPGSYYWTRIWALFVLLRWGRLNGVTTT
jgi:asparagine synthase (glutamine-hydrolysing)